MTVTIDSQTAHLLAHQGSRMRWAMSQTPPDRKEAARIQVRVDDLLDRRPALAGYAADGEAIWANSSPNVLDQIDVPFEPISRTVDETRNLGEPLSGGGVGLLDRSDPGERLNQSAEDEIRRFGSRLDEK